MGKYICYFYVYGISAPNCNQPYCLFFATTLRCIDLDYAIEYDRDTMLSARKKINESILRYMNYEGYHLSPSSRNPHTLDSWVFNYTNAGGNKDVIKIEINYSARCHLFSLVVKQINIPFSK